MEKLEEVLIILPAFNEADHIGEVIHEIRNYFPDVDILIIDDGSVDNTALKSEEAGAEVMRFCFNTGYGAALQAGYKYALRRGYRYLIQMDSDGQHDPKDIPTILKPLYEDRADIVIGSRFLGKGYRMDFFKMCAVSLFRFIIYITVHKKITDPTSGYQGMNNKVLRIYTTNLYPHDYPDADMIIMLQRLGFRILEVPVDMQHRSSASSIHKGAKVFYYMFKMFLSILVCLLRDFDIGKE